MSAAAAALVCACPHHSAIVSPRWRKWHVSLLLRPRTRCLTATEAVGAHRHRVQCRIHQEFSKFRMVARRLAHNPTLAPALCASRMTLSIIHFTASSCSSKSSGAVRANSSRRSVTLAVPLFEVTAALAHDRNFGGTAAAVRNPRAGQPGRSACAFHWRCGRRAALSLRTWLHLPHL